MYIPSEDMKERKYEVGDHSGVDVFLMFYGNHINIASFLRKGWETREKKLKGIKYCKFVVLLPYFVFALEYWRCHCKMRYVFVSILRQIYQISLM